MSNQSDHDLPVLMTSKEVLAALRISKATLHRLRYFNKIPEPVHIGGRTHWRKSDIIDFLAVSGRR